MDNFDVCRKALSWIFIDMICSHHNIAEILLKLLININQSIFSWLWSLRCERHLYYLAFTVFGLECPRWWLFQKHIHTDLVVYVFFNICWYGYSCIECTKTYTIVKTFGQNAVIYTDYYMGISILACLSSRDPNIGPRRSPVPIWVDGW